MTLLELHDVSVSFGSTQAVRSAGFSVGTGEVVAVVGESGSGKTVTAMSLLGLLPGNAEVSGCKRPVPLSRMQSVGLDIDQIVNDVDRRCTHAK